MNEPIHHNDSELGNEPRHHEDDNQHLVERLQVAINENPELLERVTRMPAIQQVMVGYSMQMHKGPLPPAEDMAAYDRALPGAAHEIMQMAIREQSHRHEMGRADVAQRKAIADGFIKQDRLGKWLGFTIAMSVLLLACLMAVLGKEGLAVVLAGIDLLGLAAVFVTGRVLTRSNAQKNEKDE